MRLFLYYLWRRWEKAIHSINHVIAFVLMSLTYIIAVTPVAMIFRIRGTDLIDRGLRKERKTFWLDKKKEEQNLSRVQRPY